MINNLRQKLALFILGKKSNKALVNATIVMKLQQERIKYLENQISKLYKLNSAVRQTSFDKKTHKQGDTLH